MYPKTKQKIKHFKDDWDYRMKLELYINLIVN